VWGVKVKFSISEQAFYSESLDYGNSLPSDAATITDEQYQIFLTSISQQKVVFMTDGEYSISKSRPSQYSSWDNTSKDWVITEDNEKKKKEDELSFAKATKQNLLDEATQKIAPLQDAMDLDIATDDEKTQLTAWKKYRVLVNRVDTSTAPNITWPTSPDDESTTSTSTATTTGDATTS